MGRLVAVSDDFDLKKYITNEKAKDKTLLTRLAKAAGHSGTSTISKWLSKPEKELDSMAAFLSIIREIAPEKEQEIIEKHAMKLDPKKKAARQMLEYLSNNRLFEAMRLLLDRMEYCSNDESRDWAKVYELQYEWQVNYFTLDIDEHLKKIRKLKLDDPSLNIFIQLMKCYAYYKKENDTMSSEIAEEILPELEALEDGFIKTAYTAKVNEVLSYINLWVKSDTVAARRNAKFVIESNIGKTYTAFAYHVIGYSYYYEEFEKAEKYLLISREIYRELGREDAVIDADDTIERIKLFWDLKDESEGFTSIQNELLYRSLKGENVTDLLETSKDELHDDAISCLIKGYSEDSNEILSQSVLKFLKKGNTFCAKVPMMALKQRGYSEIILNEMISFHL
jgi:hypothetical protein